MLVIKTLASFASRPLLWFGMLAIPILLAGTSLIGYVFCTTLWWVRPSPCPSRAAESFSSRPPS